MSVAAFLSTFTGTASASPSSNVKQIFEKALPDVSLHGWSATAVEVSYAPGASSKPHRHPGFVIGYVVEGSVRFRISGEPERVIAKGEMFYEPPGSVHLVSQNASGSESAKSMALIFAETGKPITTPA